jgi:hypothetical protein
MLKLTKKMTDEADVARAKDKYKSPQEFAEHFSYRKGSKSVVLKKPAHIARKFRELEGSPAFWDYVDDAEEEG